MNASELFANGMKLIFMASPFVLIYASITFSGGFINVIRRAVFLNKSKDWD